MRNFLDLLKFPMVTQSFLLFEILILNSAVEKILLLQLHYSVYLYLQAGVICSRAEGEAESCWELVHPV